MSKGGLELGLKAGKVGAVFASRRIPNSEIREKKQICSKEFTYVEVAVVRSDLFGQVLSPLSRGST
jgi:hypothetical protein